MSNSTHPPERTIAIQAQSLTRTLKLISNQFITTNLAVNGTNLIEHGLSEVVFQVHLAEPNQRPIGLKKEEAGSIVQENQDQDNTDGLKISSAADGLSKKDSVTWINTQLIQGSSMASHFQPPTFSSQTLSQNTTQYTINYQSLSNSPLKNLELALIYQTYEGFPIIRKWVEIRNSTDKANGIWLKIDQLVIDPITFLPDFSTTTPLTPNERGATASVIGFSDLEKTKGVIIGNEIPSALRQITNLGASGYSPDLFEWIIGPGEEFISEPVFYCGFEGEMTKTCSAISTPLDRTAESDLQQFYRDVLRMPTTHAPLPAPVWCTWSNMVANISDDVVREQAEIAEKVGFKTFQIDAGWAVSEDPADWTAGGMEPHPEKFPKFKETCEIIKKRGLHLGLWTSCFRSPSSKDLKEMPEAVSLPLVKRGHCFGMSYASPWRYYYANDILSLVQKYNATYFKQDLTNIKFGDFAEGHESRSLKESYLRALRGLLEAQRIVHEKSPETWTMLSHEIYWGTPGVPCDLAVLKSVCGFHIPPNDYSGCGPRKQRWSPEWKNKFKAKTFELKRGCFHARNRYYLHRGLPLQSLEYYGAATVNIQGSLNPKIQDRQICSWLMGMPSVYAGDLCSLTQENIEHYRKRFDLLNELEKKYGIFKHFQYSGVPKPTDTGWHWWGKINEHGEGVVVIMRGLLGAPKKTINIPWVLPNQIYRVQAHLANRPLGTFSAEELFLGKLKMKLSRWGQEILEISKIE